MDFFQYKNKILRKEIANIREKHREKELLATNCIGKIILLMPLKRIP
jgi:hypothetical protein